uniref:Uncharacterized protein n=1 Tax=Oryza nivara TaxID=4536 RepID=A0A0E0IGJ9_ORYNI
MPCLLALLALEHRALDPAAPSPHTTVVQASVVIVLERASERWVQGHRSVGSGSVPRRLVLTNGVAAAVIITITDLFSQTNRNAQIEDKYKYAVPGNGNQQRGRWRRMARKAAASAEGDDARAEGSSAHGREGRKEERGSSPASMAAGPEDEGGGDGLAMRRGGRAASTPKETAERG